MAKADGYGRSVKGNGSVQKKLPIGIDNFQKLRSDDFYYIDKTGLIKDLLFNWGEVNLFTRPRRFGKSLNMSMLDQFFSPDGDKSIFDGLKIAAETALCEEYMGKYPVIPVTMKGIEARTYETAYQIAVRVVVEAAARSYFLLDSEKLNAHDKAEYRKLLDHSMNEAVFGSSLKTLTELLEKHYGTKVILLIDEYDVPLAKASANGYYGQMVSIMRSLLGHALKTNNSLKSAVLTGCLRISKESIFTGLNNLRVLSAADTGNMGIIIEVKYAHDGNLKAACQKAFKQIAYTKYEDELADDGIEAENILKYAIACYKKQCRVELERI